MAETEMREQVFNGEKGVKMIVTRSQLFLETPKSFLVIGFGSIAAIHLEKKRSGYRVRVSARCDVDSSYMKENQVLITLSADDAKRFIAVLKTVSLG